MSRKSNTTRNERNLNAQNKRIERRSSQEMVCVAILLAMGYQVTFKRPRTSKKAKPFVSINRIYDSNSEVFNSKQLIQRGFGDLGPKMTKEEMTSLTMNSLIELLKQKGIDIQTKCHSKEQKTTKFQWIEQLQLNNFVLNGDQISDVGKNMLVIVDYIMHQRTSEITMNFNQFMEIIHQRTTVIDESTQSFFQCLDFIPI